MKKLIMIVAAGSLLVFNSCSKTGPQGPQGPQGVAGLNGNANVKGSDPFTVSSWTYNSSDKTYEASFNDPDVTQAVADRGDVEIFLQYSDGTWRNLPDIVGGTEFFSRFSLGGFDIYFANVDGSTPSFPGTNTFRSVIAPSQRQAHPNTNWKNYNEAMAALKDTPATTSSATN